MASVTLYPSGTVTGSNGTWSNASNAYDAYTTSSAASLTYSKLATTTMWGYLSVDTSSIPDGSVINSVSAVTSISIKSDYGKGSSGSWTSCGAILCAGTTEKGTLQELSEKNKQTTLTMNDASWTIDELRNLTIKFPYTTNSYGNQDSAAVLSVYGVTITVDYTEGKKYTVSIQTGDDITIDKPNTSSIVSGGSFEVNITPTNTIRTITDNGTDISSKLIEMRPSSGGTITGNPTAYTTNGNISGTRYKNCIGKGSSQTATGNDYCNSRNSTATITYSFDFSEIPENATIDSVSVSVGGHCENTSQSTAKSEFTLYSGNTQKGSTSKFTTTSKQVVQMTAGTWTRAELQNATLQFVIGYYGGLINGVDFVVVYSIPGSDGVYYVYTINSVTEDHTILINVGGSAATPLRFKVNGQYKKVLKIYKKIGGSWTEIEASSLNRNSNYKYMG